MGNSNSGRKPKEQDQIMVEELSKFSDDAYRVLHENILLGKHWAVKIWFDRMYGKSREYRDLNLTSNQDQPLFNLNFENL